MSYYSNHILPDLDEDERVECPKCGNYMKESDQGELTEGQYMEYLAGHNVPFECPECNFDDLFDVEPDYQESEEDFQYDDTINDTVIEDVIDRAIKKRCFIEVLSLIHNVIELYLKYKIKLHIFKLEGLDNMGIDLSRYKKDKKGDTIIEVFGEPTEKEKKAKIKFKLLFNSKRKYLNDYKEQCYILNLIDEDMYNQISDFNKKRNIAIHGLLREDKTKGADMKYSQIIRAAKLGRKIQLILSPIDHKVQDIERILKLFEISKEEKKKDFMLQ